jgi:Zn-dependent protease with chaperone function
MRLDRNVAALLLVLMGCVACATPSGSPGTLTAIKPGERPALDSDEAGLWMQMDRLEESLKTSGRLITDPGLNAYVREMVCKLVGPYCADIRVYVVQTPHFNASMAPNGTMQVWTGLILRAENEAQLAYVLGHEAAHYLRRHSVQLWRDVRSKSSMLVYFRLLTAAAGVGFVGPLADLAAMASVNSFSRDNEREADDLGFELMVKAGYDPREAPKIWEALLKERAASQDSAPFIFFATHPATEERIDTLKKLAETTAAGGGHGRVGKEQFLAATLPLRATLLRDELRRREFAGSQVVLDQLFAGGVGLGELHFFQGELYRLRAQDSDPERAIAAYQKTLEFADAPAEAYRALGLLFAKAGEKGKARSSFERYLQRRPDAEDRAIIDAYLRELQ